MNENKVTNIHDLYVDDPEIAAVSCKLDLDCMTQNQSEDEKIKTMLIIAAAMADDVTSTGKYTFDEVVNEIRANSGAIRRIVNRMKEEDS